MRVPKPYPPRSLTSGVWWLVAFTIFVLFPVILCVVFTPEINDWYLAEFVAPELETRFGFRGGQIQVTWQGRPYETYGITSVTPGGALASAGVEMGDIPSGFAPGNRSGFLSRLRHASGAEITLRFEPASSFAEEKRRTRIVTVRVPGGAPAN